MAKHVPAIADLNTGWEPTTPASAAQPPPHLAAAVAAAATAAAAACGVRPPSASPSGAALGPSPRNSELRRLSACEVLLQLDATLAALQPSYSPVSDASAEASTSGNSSGGLGPAAAAARVAAAATAATAGVPVDPSPLLRVLRVHLPGGVLELGEQNDAAEALEVRACGRVCVNIPAPETRDPA